MGTSKNTALRPAQRERISYYQLVTFVVSLSNHERNQFLEIPITRIL
jgi:hypothetical protein